MRTKLLWSICLALGLVGASTAVTNVTIYADSADGQLEARDTLPPTNPWPTVQDTGGWEMGIGEWYGPGLLTTVIPFQLPEYGPIANPFKNATLGVRLHNKAGFPADVDLYAVRTSTNPDILTSDWYNGSAFDPGATLIQESFLTPSSPDGYIDAPNNFTDTTGSANLLSYLNSAYDSGAGAGTFVFLRMSWGSDFLAAGTDYYKITARNSGSEGEWPRITVTIDPDADTDMDGLPDLWEGANGLDPYDDGTIDINNGAIGNPDDDGLVNSNEYALGTHATMADTDDDGLTDGEEVNTYLTNPLLSDTDEEGLSDGYEVTNSLTNPILADTDEDDEDDFREIWQGTDPQDPASSGASIGLPTVDGTRDGTYGDAVSIQTVNTSGEDNGDEVDAAYALVQNDILYLMLTGNMQTNWNKYEIFIDSTDAVTTNVLETAGNNGTDTLDGLVFDEGFSPDYHLMLRGNESSKFLNLDMANLATKAFSQYDNVFGDSMEGASYTGTGNANESPIAISLNNSNTAGLINGAGAVNQADVLAVTNGLELGIMLSDIGNPYGEIRIAVVLADEQQENLFNQVLGGLEPIQSGLGAASNVDFNLFTGEQFFTIASNLLPPPVITAIQMITSNTEVQLDVGGLISGYDYKIQETADLVNMVFSDVAGSEFTAASTNDTVIVPAGSNPTLFLQVVAP